jgi:hypothetical protein
MSAEKKTWAGMALISISMPARAADCLITAWSFCTVALAVAWNTKRSRRPSLARIPSAPRGQPAPSSSALAFSGLNSHVCWRAEAIGELRKFTAIWPVRPTR